MYMAFSKNNDGGISAYKIDSGRTPLHDLASILSRVELRQVHQDYTVRFQGSQYWIRRQDVVTGLRGAAVRVEQRLNGSLAMTFRGRGLHFELCTPVLGADVARSETKPPAKTRRPKIDAQRPPWGKNYDRRKDIPLWQAAKSRG